MLELMPVRELQKPVRTAPDGLPTVEEFVEMALAAFERTGMIPKKGVLVNVKADCVEGCAMGALSYRNHHADMVKFNERWGSYFVKGVEDGFDGFNEKHKTNAIATTNYRHGYR